MIREVIGVSLEKRGTFECMLYKSAILIINRWVDNGRNRGNSYKFLIIHSKNDDDLDNIDRN